jgi:transposase
LRRSIFPVLRRRELEAIRGDVQRFSSIKKAISHCGLCGAERSSANITMRTLLSKQRNKHLQTVLIEAAKMAPRNSPELAMVYEQEKQKGNANRATLAVAPEARSVLGCCGSAPKRVPNSRKRKPHRRLD